MMSKLKTKQPAKKTKLLYPCHVCMQECTMEQEFIQCNGCRSWLHQSSVDMWLVQYTEYSNNAYLEFLVSSLFNWQLKQFWLQFQFGTHSILRTRCRWYVLPSWKWTQTVWCCTVYHHRHLPCQRQIQKYGLGRERVGSGNGLCPYPVEAWGHSFILCEQGSSLLLSPVVRPFESVQCASPRRGGKLIGACGVCTM